MNFYSLLLICAVLSSFLKESHQQLTCYTGLEGSQTGSQSCTGYNYCARLYFSSSSSSSIPSGSWYYTCTTTNSCGWLAGSGSNRYYAQTGSFCTSNNCNVNSASTYTSTCSDATSFKSVLNVIYAFAAAFSSLGMCQSY